MSDHGLREAERQAAADPSPEAEVHLHKERLLTGELDPKRVELAARLGHPVALALYPLTYEETGRATHSLATWIPGWLPLAANLPGVVREVSCGRCEGTGDYAHKLREARECHCTNGRASVTIPYDRWLSVLIALEVAEACLAVSCTDDYHESQDLECPGCAYDAQVEEALAAICAWVEEPNEAHRRASSVENRVEFQDSRLPRWAAGALSLVAMSDFKSSCERDLILSLTGAAGVLDEPTVRDGACRVGLRELGL